MQKKLLITTLMILFGLILCGSASAATYDTDTDLTLSHNSSVPGDQINCTARVTYEVPGPNPVVPAGLQVQFWTRTTGGGGGSWSNFANGTINSTGYASAIYTVTSSSDREMEARFYQQSTGGNTYRYSDDSDDLDIDPTTTSLTVNPTTTDVGSPVTLRSRLTVGGNGWNGQTIHFFVDGVKIGSNTTATSSGQSGWANFNYTPTTSGTQNVQAFFYGYLVTGSGDCDYQYYMGSNSSQTLTVRGADIQVNKTVNNTAPNYRDYVTFTVTVRNNGPNTAVNARVTDLLPAGLNLISATPSIGGYNNVTGLWNVGNLNNGASATLTLVAQVLGHNTTITNRANGTSDTFDRNLTNNNGSASVTVPPAADIAVTKSVNNSSPNYLDLVTFTVTVRNNGPDDVATAFVDDLLPAGLVWVSDDSGGAYNHVTGTWTVNDLLNGTSATLNIVAQVFGHNTTINNVAFGYSTLYDWNLTNNNGSASVTVPPAADVAITKTVNNNTPNYLGNIIFSISVTNNGPDNATNVYMSDIIPVGLELNYSGITVSGPWTQYGYYNLERKFELFINSLAPGVTTTINLPVLVNASNTTLSNMANVTANEYDLNKTNNNSTVSITVPPAADIAVTKDVNNTAPNYRDLVTFTVIVRNNGPDDANGVTLDDLLPAGLVWVSDDSSGAYDHTTGVWTIGSLADGAFVTLNIVAQVWGHNTIIDNVANASAMEFDPNRANNRANVTINVPASADIAVTKTVNNATPNYLGNVVFTVTVINNGPDDANGVKLSDLLPAGLVWISDNPSQGSYDHVTGIWDIGNLFVEQGNVTLTITAMVNKTGNITNVANASSDLYDWNLTNNAANATVSIPQTSELVLSKTVDKAKVTVGQTVKYTITVVNNGPDAALNTVVTDILPSGMQYLSSIASTGSYDPNTGLWTIGTMANGATETLEIFVKVLATGTYENIATVSSSSSNPGSNSSGVVIDVIRNGTNGTNGSGTVPMQHTGVPIALLAFALVMMVAGIVMPKRK